MSKYKKSQADLQKCESEKNEMQAKTSILENDTTQYGIKVRSLHNDINYLENIGKSESDKLNAETERQKQMLNNTRNELAVTTEKLARVTWQLSRPQVVRDSLQKVFMDSLKTLIDARKISVVQSREGIKICLLDNGWFVKEVPFLNAEATKILDLVCVAVRSDSALAVEVERRGAEPLRAAKGADIKSESPILAKSYNLWNYMEEKTNLPDDRIKVTNVYLKSAGTKESYSLIIR